MSQQPGPEKMILDLIERITGPLSSHAQFEISRVIYQIVRDFMMSQVVSRPIPPPIQINLPKAYKSLPTSPPLPRWRSVQAPPDKKPLPSETAFGEVEATRIWRIQATSPLRLRSAFKDTIWEPGETLSSKLVVREEIYVIEEDRIASNNYDSPVLPGDYDQVGIHGWKNVGEAINYVLETENRQLVSSLIENGVVRTRVPWAFGRVKLWGQVIHHERGYRAEFAKITAIDGVMGMDSDDAMEMLEMLRALYEPKEEKKNA